MNPVSGVLSQQTAVQCGLSKPLQLYLNYGDIRWVPVHFPGRKRSLSLCLYLIEPQWAFGAHRQARFFGFRAPLYATAPQQAEYLSYAFSADTVLKTVD